MNSAVKRSIGSTTGCTITEKALVGAFSVIVQLHRLIDLRHYNFVNNDWGSLATGSLLGLLSPVLCSNVVTVRILASNCSLE